jgi:hypothetical protein
MQFDLCDEVYKSRSEWSVYSADIVKRVPKTRRIVFNEWSFPDITHNGLPITQLAVVVSSNLGVLGSSGQERNVLSGQGVKQIIFNKSGDSWVPVNDINTLEYVSESASFTFRLRMNAKPLGIVNVPAAPKLKWRLRVSIV